MLREEEIKELEDYISNTVYLSPFKTQEYIEKLLKYYREYELKVHLLEEETK